MQTIKDFGAVAVRQHTPTNHGANYTTSLQTIEQALSFIPADDRDTWIKCGMAIKAELGDAGFDAWDRWSAAADNYRARDAAALSPIKKFQTAAWASARCFILLSKTAISVTATTSLIGGCHGYY